MVGSASSFAAKAGLMLPPIVDVTLLVKSKVSITNIALLLVKVCLPFWKCFIHASQCLSFGYDESSMNFKVA